jgi:hypothetical protein
MKYSVFMLAAASVIHILVAAGSIRILPATPLGIIAATALFFLWSSSGVLLMLSALEIYSKGKVNPIEFLKHFLLILLLIGIDAIFFSPFP